MRRDMEFLLYTGVLFLAFVCLVTLIVILMQRPSANAGMGAALGGGAAEQAFGGEAGNVLTRLTTSLIVIFFLLSFGLFLGFKAKFGAHAEKTDGTVFSDMAKDAPAVPPTPPVVAPASPTAPTTPAPDAAK